MLLMFVEDKALGGIFHSFIKHSFFDVMLVIFINL